jgi:hypothetical protein
MKHPHLVVFAFDDWLAKQLRELAAESRWLLREVRQPGACLALLSDPRPTVLFAQLDPHADTAAPLALVGDVHRQSPDVAVVVVSDVKLGDDDRAAWTAAALDLGARYVLFPPLSRPVLEDVASGLMAAAVARTTYDARPDPAEPLIDLAEHGDADA